MVETDADVQEALRQFHNAKGLLLQAQELTDTTQAELIRCMNETGVSTASVKGGNITIKGTLVAGTRIVLDEPKLKKALGSQTWDKVTKKVIDKTALETQMAAGVVDPNVVAACSEETSIRPYVRVNVSAPAKPSIRTAKKGEVTGVRTPSPAGRRVKKKK